MGDISTDLIQGNCIDVMGSMEPNSVHAIVTDPPYGLAFMGNSWDDFEPKEYQEWCEEWATEAMRVLKPGGHMLAFSGSRTFHRMFVGVEDAGFEVRDTVMWMYGSGFPKGQDVGKVIDRKLGKEDEREVVGIKPGYEEFAGRDTDGHLGGDGTNEGWKRPWMEEEDADDYHKKTAPATKVASKFDGWDTQLKPAFEPVVLARNPLEEDTIAEQVMATGTGALNIDSCRIGVKEEVDTPGDHGNQGFDGDERVFGDGEDMKDVEWEADDGRHPANIVLDGESARMLDEQAGTSDGSRAHRGNPIGDGYHGWDGGESTVRGYDDSGGVSRFFYTSKSKKSERTVGGRVDCPHPTVKPIDLMEWMVELVSAEEQTVLDPFAGTGTTLMAAYNVGRNAIGIEKDPDYMETAKERVRANEEYIDEVGTEPTHEYNDATSW